MKRVLTYILLIILASLLMINCKDIEKRHSYPIVVIGDGTGAVTAAIQVARMGIDVTWISSIPMMGGMLTAAGVSAIDGNHYMPAGMWGEFREALRSHYGGAEQLASGWISHTLFEPHVGDSIFQAWVRELPNLNVVTNGMIDTVQFIDENTWNVKFWNGSKKESVTTQIIIDGTDLADMAEHCMVSYKIGAEDIAYCGLSEDAVSEFAPIQDLTYAATLYNYGAGTDQRPASPPEGYDPMEFDCACSSYCNSISNSKVHDCETMLNYAKLPTGDKYLINWPLHGNDYFMDDIMLPIPERNTLYQKAKDKTLRFIYFIQDELGYKNLGLAKDEYGTPDHLPHMPYHREGRRIKGKVKMELENILSPYKSNLYRTGVAVGDYPIDHHHLEHEGSGPTSFPAVPSFNVPLGALLSEDVDNYIIADKGMSVSHTVNGSTRLQPVIIQVGQAAGIIAALAIQNECSVHNVPIRKVQEEVLKSNGYLMPYWDVPLGHPYFTSIQEAGACGIIKGVGEPFEWANRTWFYPDSTMQIEELLLGLQPYMDIETIMNEENVSMQNLSSILRVSENQLQRLLKNSGSGALKRGEVAYLIDQILDPFSNEIDIHGELIPNSN